MYPHCLYYFCWGAPLASNSHWTYSRHGKLCETWIQKSKQGSYQYSSIKWSASWSFPKKLHSSAHFPHLDPTKHIRNSCISDTLLPLWTCVLFWISKLQLQPQARWKAWIQAATKPPSVSLLPPSGQQRHQSKIFGQRYSEVRVIELYKI